MRLIVYLPGYNSNNSFDSSDSLDLVEISLNDYTPSELREYLGEVNPDRIFWLGLEDESSLEYLANSLFSEDSSVEKQRDRLFQGYVKEIIREHYRSTIISDEKRIMWFSRLNNIPYADTLEKIL